MPRCSNVQTWSRQGGRSFNRCWTHGKHCRRRDFRTTRLDLGVLRKLTSCWPKMGDHGERSGRTSLRPSRAMFQKQPGGQPPGCAETMATNREVKILADANGIAQTAAAEFVEAARETVRAKGSFSVALAGGSTPKALYRLLVNNPLLQTIVPWSKIHFFFGDERHVPPDDAESNFRMAKEAMLAKAPIDPKQVHRVKGENPNTAEAAQ